MQVQTLFGNKGRFICRLSIKERGYFGGVRYQNGVLSICRSDSPGLFWPI